MNNQKVQICTRCVMDTTDSSIIFDAEGICNHCHEFDEVTKKRWFPNEEGQRKLEVLVTQIKKEGEGKEYDCILGLSGGLDSSYLALVMKDYGLRPLVVHVDAGWNSEDAVKNINTVVNHCGFKLHTKVVDWDEIKDLQLAYLKAGVANQDVVQDHAFFANLYHFAVDNNIRYTINGGNIATEAIVASAWHHPAMDAINLKAIHKKYGTKTLKDYETISFLDYYFHYPFVKKMTAVRPLNLMPYSKELALERLQEIGYISYDRKHGESRFTKFFQNYYLPSKFNFDKRKPHLSSLIMSNILTREQALDKLQEPLYDISELADDKAFIAERLGISVVDLDKYLEGPGRHYTDFANWDSRYALMKKAQGIITKVTGKKLNAYS